MTRIKYVSCNLAIYCILLTVKAGRYGNLLSRVTNKDNPDILMPFKCKYTGVVFQLVVASLGLKL